MRFVDLFMLPREVFHDGLKMNGIPEDSFGPFTNRQIHNYKLYKYFADRCPTLTSYLRDENDGSQRIKKLGSSLFVSLLFVYYQQVQWDVCLVRSLDTNMVKKRIIEWLPESDLALAPKVKSNRGFQSRVTSPIGSSSSDIQRRAPGNTPC